MLRWVITSRMVYEGEDANGARLLAVRLLMDAGFGDVRTTTVEEWQLEAREELRRLPAMQPYRPRVPEHVAPARRSMGQGPNA